MSLPYMRLYPGDYLADTTHLTTEEHGAYMLLIMAYWQHGGPLPADDTRLMRITRTNKRRWIAIKDSLFEFFVLNSENQLVHKRVQAEIDAAADKCAKLQAAGRASGAKRANKCSTNDEQMLPECSPQNEQTLVYPNPNPEESYLNSSVLPLTEGSSNSKRSASAPSPGAARKRKGNDGEGYRTKKGRILSGLRLESFERFWRAFDYPRGKSEAADAWYDIQPMTHALVAQIVEAAEREARARPALVASGRTPKMAQGWLTGRRWEDGEEPVPRVMNEAGRRVEANKAAAQGGFELLKQSGFFAQQAQGGTR